MKLGDTSTIPCPNPDCPCKYPMEFVEVRYEPGGERPKDEPLETVKVYKCNMCGTYKREQQPSPSDSGAGMPGEHHKEK